MNNAENNIENNLDISSDINYSHSIYSVLDKVDCFKDGSVKVERAGFTTSFDNLKDLKVS